MYEEKTTLFEKEMELFKEHNQNPESIINLEKTTDIPKRRYCTNDTGNHILNERN